jgi:hypothetical protein
MEPLIVVVLFSGFVAALAGSVVAGILPRHRFLGPAAMHPCPVPLRRRVALFSKPERSFYRMLRTLVPDHMIFVKVRLADLVARKPSDSFWEHFSPIQRKYVDFVICDRTLAPILAIELDQAGKALSPVGPARLVDSVLSAASLPVVHVPRRRRYLFNELRRLLAPYVVPGPML